MVNRVGILRVGPLAVSDDVFSRQTAAFGEHVSGIKAEVDRIDGLLRTIDQYLDVFQPPVTGKVRIVFNKYRTELRPELRVFLKSRSGTWRSNRIAKGMGTRSLRRARAFERHYDTVKVLCRAAERLLEERACLMVRLRGASSALREALKASSGIVTRLDSQFVAPYQALFASLQSS
jgi:hypothetical protein